MALMRFEVTLAAVIALMAAACPEAAAWRLDVVVGGVIDTEARSIEVTTGQETVPQASATLPQSVALKPGDALTVSAAGGPGGAAVVFKGEVVGIEPIFAVGGEARVVVRAFDRLHRLTRGRTTRTFEQQRDSDIVRTIAKDHGLAAAPEIEDDVRYDFVVQHNQTDLEFLRQRARRIGYEVLVDDTILRFRRAVEPPPLALGCGGAAEARLRAFHPRLSSAQQITKVTVRGWDPKQQEPIVGVATLRRLLPARGAAAGAPREIDLGEWRMLVTAAQGHAVARTLLEDYTADEPGGETATDGHPRLAPGARVRVDAPGLAVFAGDLEVVAALHRQIRGAGGYVTLLKFRRVDRAFFTLPEVGDEVLVAFEHGDISRPVVVGSLWDDRDRIPDTACAGSGGAK